LLAFYPLKVEAAMLFSWLIKFPYFFSEVGNGSWDSWFEPLKEQVIGQKDLLC